MILQSFRMAFSSILSSKMRSFLTMLGIIIGVIAVVVLISLVNGATASVTSEIEGLGSNLLTVTIRDSSYHRLSQADIDVLIQDNPSIGAVAPNLSAPVTARNGIKESDASVQGTTPDYQRIGSLTLQYGRFLKTPDLNDQSAVAVIGIDVADDLFGRRDVLGEHISINGRSFLVIGVLEEGASAFSGIGIMNIMLVSVTERTREIGIRKAIGASRNRILTQFLIESMVISVVGGLIGLLISWGLLRLVSLIAGIFFGMTFGVIALAFGFSLLVGVVFGIYPANKAARLHPIQALRTE